MHFFNFISFFIASLSSFSKLHAVLSQLPSSFHYSSLCLPSKTQKLLAFFNLRSVWLVCSPLALFQIPKSPTENPPKLVSPSPCSERELVVLCVFGSLDLWWLLCSWKLVASCGI